MIRVHLIHYQKETQRLQYHDHSLLPSQFDLIFSTKTWFLCCMFVLVISEFFFRQCNETKDETVRVRHILRARVLFDILERNTSRSAPRYAGRELVTMPFPYVPRLPMFDAENDLIFYYHRQSMLLSAQLASNGWCLFKLFTPTCTDAMVLDLSSAFTVPSTEEGTELEDGTSPNSASSAIQSSSDAASSVVDGALLASPLPSTDRQQQLMHALFGRMNQAETPTIGAALSAQQLLQEYVSIDRAMGRHTSFACNAQEPVQSYPLLEIDKATASDTISSVVKFVFDPELQPMQLNDTCLIDVLQQSSFFEETHTVSVILLTGEGEDWLRSHQQSPRYRGFLDALGERVYVGPHSKYPPSLRVWQHLFFQINFYVNTELDENNELTMDNGWRFKTLSNNSVCILYVRDAGQETRYSPLIIQTLKFILYNEYQPFYHNILFSDIINSFGRPGPGCVCVCVDL
eukprot:m.225654 g.225654  ORF g.225654 m.225654 type:complete len:460 (+) comp17043_c0_seq6:3031-4410(+)